MLYLQRASAGSGKTFTLARTFIRNFITTPSPEGRKLLRTERQLADSLARILAITFTNKATNEMKLRIVDKLAALADTSLLPDKVDYLKEFIDELKVTRQELADTCGKALAVMLNNYADFRVSTIDAFFQSVLRTFAYETELNDGYQVEIDTSYVDRAGIDAVLDDVNTSAGSDPEAEFWIGQLMKHWAGEGKQWNLFQRSDARRSVYNALMTMLRNLDKEDYREVKEKLDTYFEKNPDFRHIYTTLESRRAEVEGSLVQLRTSIAAKAKELLAQLENAPAPIKKTPLETVRRLSAINPKAPAAVLSKGRALKLDRWPRLFDSKSKRPDPALEGTDMELGAGFEALLADVEAHNAQLQTPFMLHWGVYRLNFAYLGLLQRIALRKREFLEANNMLELGATTSVLGRIISDDDTPFIYERLGAHLRHYLIDEFQDTSRMQWHLLSPLVHESHAKGFDSLIIGDAKQSIYRFRNADHTLITRRVPAEFAGNRLEIRGAEPQENTNWRSDRNIVMWNNVFFSQLEQRMQQESKGTADITDIYANVVQPSRHNPDNAQGFVQVRFYPALSRNSRDNDDTETDSRPAYFTELPWLVRELLERGYRQRDIAFLVNRTADGQMVIDTLIEHNAANPGLTPIEFVSEQSLLVGNSRAVRTVISALETIARTRGRRPDDKPEEETTSPLPRSEQRELSWHAIKADFAFFALQHPELSPSQRLRRFIDGDPSARTPADMIADMQAVALPALVEGLIENFVETGVRRAHAPFLAALQDMVTEYCQRYPADITSFLNWWRKEGARRSISSPEGADAVQVMTIHKSKGLEFKCVIVPQGALQFAPSPQRPELVWLPPLQADGMDTAGPLPPFVPIPTTQAALTDTGHTEIYDRYLDLFRLDRLNTVYVAFTRAVSELYVYGNLTYSLDSKTGTCSVSARSKGLMNCLWDFCRDFATAAASMRDATGIDPALEMNSEVLPAPAKPIGVDKEGNPLPSAIVYDWGQPLHPGTKADDNDTAAPITDYPVWGHSAILQYREAEAPPEVADDPEADPDPRSLGNLLHAVMADIRTAPDLHAALLRWRVKGMMPRAMAREAETVLAEALKRAPHEWFDGSMSVLNERPLLTHGQPERRPDRVMVSPEGRCVVVDYKFGLPGKASQTTLDAYRRQVARYVRMLRSTGRYRSVEGWLWHVPYDAPKRVE